MNSIKSKGHLFLFMYVIFLISACVIAFFTKNNEVLDKLTLSATFAGFFFAYSEHFFILGDDLKNRAKFLSNQKEEERLKNLQKIEGQKKTSKTYIIISRVSFTLGVLSSYFVPVFYNKKSFFFKQLEIYEKPFTILAFALVILGFFFKDFLPKLKEKELQEVVNQAKKENIE